MRALDSIASIGDLRDAARRALPRFVFDYVDGGAEDESASRRSREAFDRIEIAPRALRDVSARSTRCTLFGREWAAPFGIGPTGLAGLTRPGADLLLSSAARDAGVPFTLSTPANSTVEDVARQGSDHLWFQLYMPRDRAVGADLLARADRAGCRVAVLTVDVPVPGRRARDIRNGFALPMRWTPRTLADMALRPAWSLRQAVGGPPRLAHWEAYARRDGVRGGSARVDDGRGGVSAESLAALQAAQIDPSLDWDALRAVRGHWPHALLVKGVLHPEDAVRALECGADGVVVSAHGGRQLDAAPAPVSVLPAIRAAVGASAKVLVDGGIRSGTDVARALAAGADFCLVGRPTLYGVAAFGAAGAARALAIIGEGFDRAMAMAGIQEPAAWRRGAA